MAEYVGVLVLLALIGVPTLLLVAWAARGQGSPSAEAGDPSSSPEAPESAGLGFFLAAVAFVVLEGAGLLMVAWALAAGPRGQTEWLQAALFVLPLTVGFAYAWRKGALGR